ncbi:MAG: peptidoglycan -binding protein [Acetobacteraceae bacterium]|nr:peptidoglycan -binding protein [Acetobacteraceae bacterium]MBV8592090.1 peptidoglycan -binding protein [Acetobacteraceae bacterium]
MPNGLRRRAGNGLEAWPGYVDALSTLLMVIIFVLLVFVLSQAFLAASLSGRNQELERANRQLAEVSQMLAVEHGQKAQFERSISELHRELEAATAAHNTVAAELSGVREKLGIATRERDLLSAERQRLTLQLQEASNNATAAESRVAELQARVANEKARNLSLGRQAIAVASQLAGTREQLAGAQSRLSAMQQEVADQDRTVRIDKDTIQARLTDIAKLTEQTRALSALRDELEQRAQQAAARAITEQQYREAAERQLADERTLGDSARAEIALLNRQVGDLKSQLLRLGQALDVADEQIRDKDRQIANLGQKLNLALAAKVEELQRYRSEFFGRLREILADRPGIQVVGDRFVFQSEVLFPLGSADLTGAGQEQMRALAATVRQIAKEIPKELNWILRVDGHADKLPITRGVFASNWELSAARAITVVKLLIAEGVPPEHLAATGFADFQPLGKSSNAEALAKNRRIELRLTER